MISTVLRPTLAEAVTRSVMRQPTSSLKRHTSNSASAIYINAFEAREMSYIKAMGGATFPLLSFPKLVSDALKVESVMLRTGKQPLTHSTPATLRPAISLTTQLSSFREKTEDAVKSPFQEQLRVSGQTFESRQVDQYMLRIQRLKNSGDDRPDHNREIRKALLATNYALLSNPIKGESSAYYVARNWMADKDPETAIAVATTMIQEALKLHGFSDAEIDEIVQAYQPLLREYMQLPLGDLYILAVPNQLLPRIAFDCKAYGVPTYKNPQAVLSSVGSCSRLTSDGGHQARVVISPKVLHASDGIDIVYTNSSQQVEKYTANHSLIPAEEVEIFSPFNLGQSSEVEQSYRERKSALDRRCQLLEQQILERFKAKMATKSTELGVSTAS